MSGKYEKREKEFLEAMATHFCFFKEKTKTAFVERLRKKKILGSNFGEGL